MKKVLLCLTLVGAAFLAGCAEEEVQFQLEEWKVVNEMDVPKLQIKFSATDNVELTLLDPDGVETDWVYTEKGVTGAKLRMADYGKTPPSGTYTLLVKDSLGEQITSLTFNFSGAKLKVIGVTPTWQYWSFLEYYALEDLAIKVENTGDLPAYITEVEINIDGEMIDTAHPVTQCILPKEAKTITISTYISEISPGTHTLKITLRDSAETVMATYRGMS